MSEDGYAFGTIDELGEGYGFRKVRQALGVEAFGVNVVVMAPDFNGFFHYHDDLVLLVVGAKGGYVGRDGQMVDPADVERRRAFGSGG